MSRFDKDSLGDRMKGYEATMKLLALVLVLCVAGDAGATPAEDNLRALDRNIARYLELESSFTSPRAIASPEGAAARMRVLEDIQRYLPGLIQARAQLAATMRPDPNLLTDDEVWAQVERRPAIMEQLRAWVAKGAAKARAETLQLVEDLGLKKEFERRLKRAGEK